MVEMLLDFHTTALMHVVRRVVRMVRVLLTLGRSTKGRAIVGAYAIPRPRAWQPMMLRVDVVAQATLVWRDVAI